MPQPQFNLSVRGQLTDLHYALAAANTWERLLPSNENWNFLWIQNPAGAGEVLFVSFGALAAADTDTALQLAVGEKLLFQAPNYMIAQQINVRAATIAHKIICWGA